jgi:hypothetical protein
MAMWLIMFVCDLERVFADCFRVVTQTCACYCISSAAFCRLLVVYGFA